MSRVGVIGGPTAPVRAARSVRPDGRFGSTLDAAAGPAEPPEAMAGGAVTQAAALLSLQEIPDATARNRRAREAAEAALEALGGLQRALLGGTLDRAGLEALARVARDAADAEDPRLREAAEAVALRAAVELARLEQPAP